MCYYRGSLRQPPFADSSSTAQACHFTRYAIAPRVVALALGCLTLLFLAGCRSKAAKDRAEDFFKSFSEPTVPNERQWGLKSFRVFGRSSLGIAAGDSDVEEIDKKAHDYEVRIPLWCSGTRGDGTKAGVCLKRDLCVRYRDTAGGGEMEFLGFEFQNEEALPPWRPYLSWGSWSLIVPSLLAFLVFLMSLGGRASIVGRLLWAVMAAVCLPLGIEEEQREAAAKYPIAATVIIAVLGVPFSGYVAKVCFGTWAAVWFAMGTYIVVGSWLPALIPSILIPRLISSFTRYKECAAALAVAATR